MGLRRTAATAAFFKSMTELSIHPIRHAKSSIDATATVFNRARAHIVESPTS
jgi:hypothetical protein